MNGKTGILVAVGTGALGIFLLVYASIQASARQYVRVHQLVEQGERYDRKRIKLSGEIVGDSVHFQPDRLRLRFRVKDVAEVSSQKDWKKGAKPETEIVYEGPKPDAFREGGVAIVKGIYHQETNRIEASNLQAKCPSRYKKEANEQEQSSPKTSTSSP